MDGNQGKNPENIIVVSNLGAWIGAKVSWGIAVVVIVHRGLVALAQDKLGFASPRIDTFSPNGRICGIKAGSLYDLYIPKGSEAILHFLKVGDVQKEENKKQRIRREEFGNYLSSLSEEEIFRQGRIDYKLVLDLSVDNKSDKE